MEWKIYKLTYLLKIPKRFDGDHIRQRDKLRLWYMYQLQFTHSYLETEKDPQANSADPDQTLYITRNFWYI